MIYFFEKIKTLYVKIRQFLCCHKESTVKIIYDVGPSIIFWPVWGRRINGMTITCEKCGKVIYHNSRSIEFLQKSIYNVDSKEEINSVLKSAGVSLDRFKIIHRDVCKEWQDVRI